MPEGQPVRIRKHESNPYRPDLPENLREISPSLYDFLREVTETLREQHNLSQAGDSTFVWEIMTEVDLKPRYNVGSLGRFYHPTFGLIHARYCRLAGMIQTEWLGAPVGLRVDPVNAGWRVTNDISKSSPDLVLGLGAWYVHPPEDSYGWVIVSGVNIQALAIRKVTEPIKFDKLAWIDTEWATDSAAADGREFAILNGLAVWAEAIPGEQGWKVPAGAVIVDFRSDSEHRIRSWILAALAEPQHQIENLLLAVSQLEGDTGLAGLSQRIEAAEKALEIDESNFARHSELAARNFLSINDRITILENKALSANVTNTLSSLRFELNQLTNEFRECCSKDDTRIGVLQGQMSAALAVTTSVEGELSAIRSELLGMSDRTTELGLLDASGIAFAPVGDISAITVQAAIAELDSEKATATALSGKLSGTPLSNGSGTSPTLNAPWTNYGSGFVGVKYFKSPDGVVHVYGMIQAPGGSSTSGVTLFALPVGYRPAESLAFAVAASGGTIGQIDITAAGDVIMRAGNVTFTSLAGINFIPA